MVVFSFLHFRGDADAPGLALSPATLPYRNRAVNFFSRSDNVCCNERTAVYSIRFSNSPCPNAAINKWFSVREGTTMETLGRLLRMTYVRYV